MTFILAMYAPWRTRACSASPCAFEPEARACKIPRSSLPAPALSARIGSITPSCKSRCDLGDPTWLSFISASESPIRPAISSSCRVPVWSDREAPVKSSTVGVPARGVLSFAAAS